MCRSVEAAKYILNRYMEEDKPISNLELQKKLSEIEKSYSNEEGKRFFDEEFEKWEIGDVIPEVYYKFVRFGVDPIYLPKGIRFDETKINLPDVKKKFIEKELAI